MKFDGTCSRILGRNEFGQPKVCACADSRSLTIRRCAASAGRLFHCGAGHALFINSQQTHSQVWRFEESESPVTAVHFWSFELGGDKSLQTPARGGTDASSPCFRRKRGWPSLVQIFNLLLLSCTSIMDGIDRKENGWQWN
jgi:hypothetical protein